MGKSAPDIVFLWRAPFTASVSIGVCDASAPLLAWSPKLYITSTVTRRGSIICSGFGNTPGCGGGGGTLRFNVTAGTEYFVVVDGPGLDINALLSGYFTLTMPVSEGRGAHVQGRGRG